MSAFEIFSSVFSRIRNEYGDLQLSNVGKYGPENLWITVLFTQLKLPVGNYMFKVSNRNTRTSCEICSELTIKTPEQSQRHRSGVFIVNCEHISYLALVCFCCYLWANKCRLGYRLRFCPLYASIYHNSKQIW